MPRSQLVKMECDFCQHSETFDLTTGVASAMIPKLKKWIGVVGALDSAGPNAPDTTKWYDSAACVTSGLKRDAEASKMEMAFAGATGAAKE